MRLALLGFKEDMVDVWIITFQEEDENIVNAWNIFEVYNNESSANKRCDEMNNDGSKRTYFVDRCEVEEK